MTMDIEEQKAVLLAQKIRTEEALENARDMERTMEQNGVLWELKGQVSEGFRGVHNRLDTLNGKTSENTKGLVELSTRVTILEQKQEGDREKDGIAVASGQRRKDWAWGAAEKVIFIVIGAALFVAGIVLKKLGILNL